ncbi:hypothetical protein HO133_003650 [Letharia lupina]|uniref:BTB domain-containing protein n=1 Tax=Letharia lupina TaxID=560253 RepID=A0A8H6CA38_9LECA|nr:uncharacterized protein HO133_003650 [Letharia lupina]KAF6219825.1 hypothetical protein HO133_003650 [Letharia lupina]
MSTSSEQPEKPLHQLLTTSLVDIYVGSENTDWTIHEKLLCYHSPFFRKIFYGKENRESKTKSYGLPDSDDLPFELFVGWLYSRALRYPEAEKDVGPLLDLYFLSEQFQITKLSDDVVETVRAFYHNNETYPGLRRVQYVYANTSEDNEMREMMVNSVARYLTLSDAIPAHWENALKKNGQLSVDIIRSIQQWHLEGRSVPDARDVSQDRGREKVGFSAVAEGMSMTEIKDEDVDLDHSKTNGSS